MLRIVVVIMDHDIPEAAKEEEVHNNLGTTTNKKGLQKGLSRA